MSLKLNNVTKSFGETLAVNQLSLEIPKRQIYGFLGANGAGKTTTIRLILGLLTPNDGVIFWDGQKIDYKLSDSIGYLPEERGLYPKLTVSDQLSYLGRLKGMGKHQVNEELDKWLRRFNILDYKDRKLEELSKGNQQKIQFIAAILHNPNLLFLDEPFSGLDPVNVEILKDAIVEIAEKGTTIVFSSHRMDHVEELCQNICIIDKGKPIVEGNLKEIKRSFGKKNVIIDTDGNFDQIKNIEGVLNFRKTAQGYVVQISNEAVSQEILKEIAPREFISKFVLEEPSLKDIFIEKVGASYE